MSNSRMPLNINYTTDNFFVRELEPSDASQKICDWMARPDVAKALNAPLGKLNLDDLTKYISSHNRIDSHMLGIFDKHTKALIGFWSVYLDFDHKEYLLNVLLTERGQGDIGPRRETARPLYHIMFMDLGMEELRFSVLSSNERMRNRITRTKPEHVSEVKAANGNGTEKVEHFRVSKAEYLARRAERLEREAAETQLAKAG